MYQDQNVNGVNTEDSFLKYDKRLLKETEPHQQYQAVLIRLLGSDYSNLLLQNSCKQAANIATLIERAHEYTFVICLAAGTIYCQGSCYSKLITIQPIRFRNSSALWLRATFINTHLTPFCLFRKLCSSFASSSLFL